MANKFTAKEYQKVKNNSYYLVVFRNGKRVMTYSNLSMPKLVEEIQKYQKNDLNTITLVIPTETYEAKRRPEICSRKIPLNTGKNSFNNR